MEPRQLGTRLGKGKESEVFAVGQHAVKLYRSEAGKSAAFREAMILVALEGLDLSSPVVISVEAIGTGWGLRMTRAEGPSFGLQLQNAPDITELLAAMARLHRRIHRLPGTHMPSQKGRLRERIESTALLSAPTRRRLLDKLAEMPAGDRLCHGDFHPFNVIGYPGAETIIDWVDACQGDPAADLCRSFVLLDAVDPQLARRYRDAYALLTGLSPDEINQWLPLIAAARLEEDVPHETERLLAMAEAV